jgi:hypothetical protein
VLQFQLTWFYAGVRLKRNLSVTNQKSTVTSAFFVAEFKYYMMIHCPVWTYFPDCHNFAYTANIRWPGATEQLDWIQGITEVESWLLSYTGPKYQQWAWNRAEDAYDISVAFRYDKHRMLFVIAYG